MPVENVMKKELEELITAPMPNPVISGSMVSPSLLAFMEKKYNQAIPLYRQEH